MLSFEDTEPHLAEISHVVLSNFSSEHSSVTLNHPGGGVQSAKCGDRATNAMEGRQKERRRRPRAPTWERISDDVLALAE